MIVVWVKGNEILYKYNNITYVTIDNVERSWRVTAEFVPPDEVVAVMAPKP